MRPDSILRKAQNSLYWLRHDAIFETDLDHTEAEAWRTLSLGQRLSPRYREKFKAAGYQFGGSIWASHQNCRALVPHNRQFTDEQIKALIQRGAVVGAALDAWMMVPGWVRGKTTAASVDLKLERVVDHIDRVCQIAGNARHSGIGSDLDGAFGREQTPTDLETIADLGRIPALLSARGFQTADVELIVRGNFIRFLRDTWK